LESSTLAKPLATKGKDKEEAINNLSNLINWLRHQCSTPPPNFSFQNGFAWSGLSFCLGIFPIILLSVLSCP
jgi:hypothetical protein